MSARADRTRAVRRPKEQPDRHPDIVALIFGLMAVGLSGSLLWLAVTGSINWEVIKIGAPVLLVVAGIVGLALSRNRNP